MLILATYPDRADGDVQETFNQFFAAMILYDLSKQWVLQPGAFNLDYSWLTAETDDPDFQDRVNGVFRKHYGVDLADFKLLDHAAIWNKVV